MNAFQGWMRTTFVAANTALEFEVPSDDVRARLLDDLLHGQELLPDDRPSGGLEDAAMHAHLLTGMLHAAYARHGLAADPRVARCEQRLLAAAERWSVAPRFLAGPYLFLNQAVDGWPQTFLRNEDERLFIEANTTGVGVYEAVWTLVARTRLLGLTHPSAPALLRHAASALAGLRALHQDLAAHLTRHVYVGHIRHYYEGAAVAGVHWHGVNAGDQAWSMALDLALGVAQESPPYIAYLQSRLPYLTPSHRDLVTRELAGRGWIDEATRLARDRPALRTALLVLYDTLVDVTWAHHDLAVQFVDEATGTSGTEMRFLEETVRMRRDAPLLGQLRGA